MNILNDPSVKKYYRNQVIEIPMKKLESYDDVAKIKLFFNCC